MQEGLKRILDVVLREWFSAGLGSVRWMVALNDLSSLFKPKWFYDSVKLRKLNFHMEGSICGGLEKWKLSKTKAFNQDQALCLH